MEPQQTSPVYSREIDSQWSQSMFMGQETHIRQSEVTGGITYLGVLESGQSNFISSTYEASASVGCVRKHLESRWGPCLGFGSWASAWGPN